MIGETIDNFLARKPPLPPARRPRMFSKTDDDDDDISHSAVLTCRTIHIGAAMDFNISLNAGRLVYAYLCSEFGTCAAGPSVCE